MDAEPDAGLKELPNGGLDVHATAEPADTDVFEISATSDSRCNEVGLQPYQSRYPPCLRISSIPSYRVGVANSKNAWCSEIAGDEEART